MTQRKNNTIDNGQLTKDNLQFTTHNSPLIRGYKNTEIGLIPEDWDVKELGKIGSFSKGQGIRKDQSNSGNIPCIRYGEIYTKHNDYIKEFYSYISDEVSQTSKKLKSGDILFAGSGETKSEIGKSVAFTKKVDAFAGGDIVILSPRNVNSLFLGFLLNDRKIQKQKSSRGQGDAVVHISATQLAKIQIPLPPLSEQKAIATVLSDTDNLIQALEKKIAKKQLIKKGAMQVLLSPPKTLSTDNGQLTMDNLAKKKDGWVTRTLGEEVELITKGTTPTSIGNDFVNKGINFIKVESLRKNGNFDKNMFAFIDFATHSALKRSQLKEFDLLISIAGALGRTGIVKKEVLPANTNQAFAIARLKSNTKINLNYLYHFLRTESIQKYIDTVSSQGAQPNLSLQDISELSIVTPILQEQIQIAKILSDMDAEIEALKKKSSKYKSLKQGLMQVLLTGKKRLDLDLFDN